jgi:hypothetical protein
MLFVQVEVGSKILDDLHGAAVEEADEEDGDDEDVQEEEERERGGVRSG